MSTPEVLTVATAVLAVRHMTERSKRAFPLASSAVAVSCCVAPWVTVVLPGEIITFATGTRATVTVAVAVFDAAEKFPFPGALAVTVMVALPGAMAVTTPFDETTATPGLAVPKVTVAAGAPFGRTSV